MSLHTLHDTSLLFDLQKTTGSAKKQLNLPIKRFSYVDTSLICIYIYITETQDKKKVLKNILVP